VLLFLLVLPFVPIDTLLSLQNVSLAFRRESLFAPDLSPILSRLRLDIRSLLLYSLLWPRLYPDSLLLPLNVLPAALLHLHLLLTGRITLLALRLLPLLHLLTLRILPLLRLLLPLHLLDLALLWLPLHLLDLALLLLLRPSAHLTLRLSRLWLRATPRISAASNLTTARISASATILLSRRASLMTPSTAIAAIATTAAAFTLSKGRARQQDSDRQYRQYSY
jgi:hypothetical protein